MKDRIELNGMWDVFVGQQKYSCNIPAPIQSIQELGSDFPSDAMPNGYLGEVWLEKIFVLDDIPQYNAKLVFLGVMPYAEVWLNGQMAARSRARSFNFLLILRGFYAWAKIRYRFIFVKKILN